MKKFFCFIGVGLVIGAAAAITMNYRNNKEKTETELKSENNALDKDEKSVDEYVVADATTVQDEPSNDDVKNHVVGTVRARHKDAGIMIKDSIETIQDNASFAEDIADKIDAVSDELGKMLEEN